MDQSTLPTPWKQRTGGNKDQPPQPRKDGEPLGRDGAAKGVTSWVVEMRALIKKIKAILHVSIGRRLVITSECPKARVKLGRIRSPDPEILKVKTKGLINGKECPVVLDTGATKSAVPGRLVQQSGGQVKVTLADMSETYMKEAEVKVDIEGETKTLKVIMLRDDAPDVLLGTDHPIIQSMLVSRTAKVGNPVPAQARAITRAQSRAQAQEWVEDIVADARDKAMPKPPLKSNTPH